MLRRCVSVCLWTSCKGSWQLQQWWNSLVDSLLKNFWSPPAHTSTSTSTAEKFWHPSLLLIINQRQPAGVNYITHCCWRYRYQIFWHRQASILQPRCNASLQKLFFFTRLTWSGGLTTNQVSTNRQNEKKLIMKTMKKIIWNWRTSIMMVNFLVTLKGDRFGFVDPNFNLFFLYF